MSSELIGVGLDRISETRILIIHNNSNMFLTTERDSWILAA